jgi:hypothetical protein
MWLQQERRATAMTRPAATHNGINLNAKPADGEALLNTTTGEIEELVQFFEDCTLPHSQWTHRAHLIVTLWYLSHWSGREALVRIRAGIKRFNAAHGIKATRSGGYHETVTVFWVFVVARFLLFAQPGRPLAELTEELVSLYADRNLPFEYYTRERLESPEARLGWVSPDLKPLS